MDGLQVHAPIGAPAARRARWCHVCEERECMCACGRQLVASVQLAAKDTAPCGNPSPPSAPSLPLLCSSVTLALPGATCDSAVVSL